MMPVDNNIAFLGGLIASVPGISRLSPRLTFERKLGDSQHRNSDVHLRR